MAVDKSAVTRQHNRKYAIIFAEKVPNRRDRIVSTRQTQHNVTINRKDAREGLK